MPWLLLIGRAVFGRTVGGRSVAGRLLDEDLVRDGAAERAVLAVDPQHQWAVERLLLPHLDAHAGAQAERVEERDDLGIGGSGHRDDRDVAGLERVERRHLGELAGLGLGDREPVRAGLGPVERDEQAVLDLLGQLVLERGREPVGLVPGVTEQVGEEPLDDAVPADGADRGAAADGREHHAAVGRVVDEAPIGEPLHRRGDRSGAQPEPVRERAGVRLPVLLGEPVDGFQRFAL